MPIHFRALTSGDRSWRLLNELHRAMDGRGAVFDTTEGSVQIMTRLGADWSADKLSVEVTRESFRDLAQAMMDADPMAARKAFGSALVLGPCEPVFDEAGRELG